MSIVYRNTEISDNFQRVFGPPPLEMSDPNTPYPKSQEQKIAANTYLQYVGQWRGILTPEALDEAGQREIVASLEMANTKAYIPWGLGRVVLYVMEIGGKREIHQAWPDALVYQTEFMDWRPFHEPGLDFNAESHIMDVQSQQIERGRAVFNPYPKLDGPSRKKNDELLAKMKAESETSAGKTKWEEIPLKF